MGRENSGKFFRPQVILMDEKAEHVIIGGGIAGCSLAYFLAKKGVKDIRSSRKGLFSK